MNTAAMKKRIEELEAKLEARDNRPIKFKVANKGGLSMYGLGRFPVTLYKEQWLKLLDHVEDIRQALKENDKDLKVKE